MGKGVRTRTHTCTHTAEREKSEPCRHVRLQRTLREANSGKRATLVVQRVKPITEESNGHILDGVVPLEPLGALLHTFLTTVPAV